LPGEVMLGLDMDYDSIQKAGSGLGSGAVIIMDETTCMVEVLLRISEFYMDESCGQCTPCREGTGWLVRILHRIHSGNGTKADIDQLVHVANNIEGRTICALGEAAAWPVQSFIKHFRHEFEYFVKHKRSIVSRQHN
jgi:NADH-quinone oxidoreductase subunit F